LRIGIDARCLEWDRGGVARILANMFTRWPKMRDRHRYILFWESHVPKDDFLTQSCFEHVVMHVPHILQRPKALCEQLLLPWYIKRANLDLFFAPWYTAPLLCACPKTIIGAWDISYTTHGEHFPFGTGFWLSSVSKHVCRRASGIFTCSPFDGRQIEKYYGVPGNKICVLPLAADDKFKPTNDLSKIESIRLKYHMSKRYILSLGVIHNRRNVDVIIKAFQRIYDEFPDAGLLVAGFNVTQPRVDIEGLMKPLIWEGRGWYLPRVPEEELIDIYSSAWYYVCTSTVDGETIMLKESMRCGTPVITSPLLEESIDGRGIIIQDPMSVEETAETFRRIFSYPDLRERYAREGYEWVQTLSWDKTAELALMFLENL